MLDVILIALLCIASLFGASMNGSSVLDNNVKMIVIDRSINAGGGSITITGDEKYELIDMIFCDETMVIEWQSYQDPSYSLDGQIYFIDIIENVDNDTNENPAYGRYPRRIHVRVCEDSININGKMYSVKTENINAIEVFINRIYNQSPFRLID